MMANNNGRKNSFIVQAGILATAGIISRLIGLLYRGPLHAVIGDLGLGYYQSAHNYYTIILLISSYSIPSAISKVIAQKLAVREYRSAHRIFKCALGYVLVVGGAASLLMFFGAGFLCGKGILSSQEMSVLRAFAPTIFIYGILGVLRGYFQAHGSMVQTSVSQILEQIVNAVVSVGAAWLLIQGVMGTMEIPADEAGQVERAVNGAMGSAMGAGAGVLAALLFMAAVYGLNRNTINRRIRNDRHVGTDSYKSIMRLIVMIVTPFILSTAIYNLSGTINNTVYTQMYPSWKEMDEVAVFKRWGALSGQALTLSNIPIAFATAMASAIIPSVAQLAASYDWHGARERIALAVKTIMLISIPCAVGLFALARPITGLLFTNTKETEDLVTSLLMALSLSVVFYALSTLNSSILQGLGKVNVPIINAAIALAIQTLTAILLLRFTELDLYSIAIANTLYSGIMCILNQWAVRRAVEYRQELMKSFLIPAVAAGCMGGVAWAAYEGLLMLTSSPKISVVIAIVLAVAVYFVMLLLLRGISEEELRGFPKGYLLVRLAKRCRLMK
ncbi:MAG: polysaccharide biosynthesis protein [Lachnospiraceae bacterium]|jgi:stage V sporulation protein B|nr:polysaccharide biosynthesis protein [Lachnospiraceae bacterium]